MKLEKNSGGALCISESEGKIYNSTFFKNSASFCGGNTILVF